MFDCDGVLVDSEPASISAWVSALNEMGIPAEPAELSGWIGRTDRDIAVHYAPRANCPVDDVLERANRAFAGVLKNNRLVPFADATAMIDRVRSAELGVACATNSSRWRLDLILEASSLSDRFEVTRTSDEVPSPKPDPDVYLAAIAGLGVEPRSTLVIEDSPVGIAAGRAAGCRVVAVDRGIFPASELSAADRVVESLDGLMR